MVRGRPGVEDEPASKKAAGPAQGATRVSFAYSPEKEKLLLPLIDRFNREPRSRDSLHPGHQRVLRRRRDADRARPVQAGGVVARLVAVGAAAQLRGRPPVHRRRGALDRPHAARDRRLGADGARARLPAAASSASPTCCGCRPRARAGRSSGKPEFGDFKLVHTNPDFSTSGLSFVVAEYYAALGKKEGLTEKDISNAAARKRVRDIERSIVHYGDTTLFIAEQLKKEGPGYASAVAMEEVTLLDFNRTRGDLDKLIAIYPEEGTFDSDSPFFVLDADWVTAGAEAGGAKAFQKYLAEEITPEVAAKSGFRPADRETAPVAPITAANGADPKQPERVLAATRAARAGGDQEGLAPRPQAREHPARARHLGLHERRAAARAREGGARRLLQERRAAGLGRADDLLREGPAARGAGAAEQERRRAARAGCAT